MEKLFEEGTFFGGSRGRFRRLGSTILSTAHPSGSYLCLPFRASALSVTLKQVRASKGDGVGGDGGRL